MLGLALCTGAFATVHTVNNSNFTFSPATLTVMEGDTIDFSIGGSHNVVQVDSSTWASNGNTPLSGGLSTPFGGGMLVLNDVGTFFYVCSPHAGLGMKGQITVEATTVSIASLNAEVISIYPNPASEKLTVSLLSDQVYQSVEISNLKGQVILSQNVENAIFDIDLPASAKGIYILRLQSGQGVLNKKIILE